MGAASMLGSSLGKGEWEGFPYLSKAFFLVVNIILVSISSDISTICNNCNIKCSDCKNCNIKCSACKNCNIKFSGCTANSAEKGAAQSTCHPPQHQGALPIQDNLFTFYLKKSYNLNLVYYNPPPYQNVFFQHIHVTFKILHSCLMCQSLQISQYFQIFVNVYVPVSVYQHISAHKLWVIIDDICKYLQIFVNVGPCLQPCVCLSV